MLTIEKVSKVYRKHHRKVLALSDVNLCFGEKGLVCLVGNSGSGKTTLLNLLALLLRPTSGRILFNGQNVSSLSGRKADHFRSDNFGIVFQDINLIQSLSVLDNVSLPLWTSGKAFTRQEAERLLLKVGMGPEFLDSKPVELSGGQEQRVAIARALSKNPKIILADEPTGSLDAKNAEAIFGLLRSEAQSRLVIVVTHDVSLAQKYADRLIAIKNGMVVSDSAPEDEKDKKKDALVLSPNGRLKLPFLKRAQMGLNSFAKSPVKMILSLFSFVLTLSCVLVSLTYYSFDGNAATQAAIEQTGLSSVCLTKKPGETNDGISSSEAESVRSAVGDSCLAYHLETINNSFFSETGNRSINNFTIGIPAIYEDPFGLKIVGNWPRGSSNEISGLALSAYVCYQLGWITENQMTDENVLSALVSSKTFSITYFYGDKINQRSYAIPITGIVETGYKEMDPTIDDVNYRSMFQEDESFGLHRCVFLSETELTAVRQLERDYYSAQQMSGPSLDYDAIFVPAKTEYFQLCTYVNAHNDFEIRFTLSGVLDSEISKAKSMANSILLIAAILFVISFISFASLVYGAIEDELPMIMVLRSLGVSLAGCFGVFVYQDIVMSIGSAFFSSIAYLASIFFLNHYEAGASFMIVPLLSFQWWLPVLVLFGTFVFASAITGFFLFGVYSKKSIRQED